MFDCRSSDEAEEFLSRKVAVNSSTLTPPPLPPSDTHRRAHTHTYTHVHKHKHSQAQGTCDPQRCAKDGVQGMAHPGLCPMSVLLLGPLEHFEGPNP